jgi:PIN domain nuclease of toxin-antitoxin system
MNKDPRLLLDTHVWVHYINATSGLRPETIRTIDKALISGSVFISVISIWEIALLVRLKRLALQTTVSQWAEQALKLPGTSLLALTPEIAIDSVDLPGPMHKDPSDRIVVSTARIERLTLVTRDGAILAFAKATKLACMQA